MIGLHTEYVTDENGNKKAVLLPIKEWGKVLEELEELDDIRAYDAVKAKPSQPISFDEAVKDIEEDELD